MRFSFKTLLLASILAATPAVGFAQDAPASGGDAAASGESCTSSDFREAIRRRESAGSGGYQAVSSLNYIGAYQMGEQALVDVGYITNDGNFDNSVSNYNWTAASGVSSTDGFLNNEAAQEAAYTQYARNQLGYMSSTSRSFVGQTLPDGTPTTESSLVFASQFGTGRIDAYFRNGMQCSSASSDRNNVCVDSYMRDGSGYDISDITGGSDTGGSCGAAPQQPWDGDTNSRTCAPMIRMQNEIPCAQYPASLMPFCVQYKPKLMTMQDCVDAENYAKNAPPSGPHVEECKKQTFRDGTGAWSYVLACANAEPPASTDGYEQDGRTGETGGKAMGNADDPACYGRLRARGIEFQEQGKVDVSTGGTTCIVKNSLVTKGSDKAPLASNTQMDCLLAEQLADFQDSVSSQLGVTRIGHKGVISCRPMKGGGSGTSLHSFGIAIDLSEFHTGSGKNAINNYWRDSSVRPFADQVQQIACSAFAGVLGFRFYRHTISDWHIHAQTKKTSVCDPSQ